MDGFDASGSHAVLEVEILDELLEVIGAEAVAEALGLFHESAAEGVAKIVAALPRGDIAEAGRHAHALKSSSALLGAAAFSAAMARLEVASRRGDAAQAQTIGRGVEALLATTLSALEKAVRRLA